MKENYMDSVNSEWDVVVGLEVHAQIISNTKLFSRSSTEFVNEHNTLIDQHNVALPGMLPLINKVCVEQAIKTGLGLNSTINLVSSFDRKHYIYPDLPQGYQITQFYQPIASGGFIMLSNGRKIEIERLHMEQDAGKLIHKDHSTYIDYNRAGVGLMEIVTAPDLRSSEEAKEFIKTIRLLLRHLKTCDGDMEKGSLRCDANVSIKPKGSTELGIRCEIKNVNSTRNLGLAIDTEVRRQIELIKIGKKVVSYTLSYDAENNVTKLMRKKEITTDYRYFPDPDLFPLVLKQEDIDKIKLTITDLPSDKKEYYISQGINSKDADVIVSSKAVMTYFDDVVAASKLSVKEVYGFICVDLFFYLTQHKVKITDSHVTVDRMVSLLKIFKEGKISKGKSKKLIDLILTHNKEPEVLMEEFSLAQIDDRNTILKVVEKIVLEDQESYIAYKNGKERLLGYFLGKIMKESNGNFSPKVVNEVLLEVLSK